VSSPRPRVLPLRFEDVTIRQLKRRARGTAPLYDPGPVGVEGDIPLSVRFEKASCGSSGAH